MSQPVRSLQAPLQRSRSCVFLLTICLAGPAYAVDDGILDLEVDVRFIVGLPQGDFDDNIEGEGYGAELFVGAGFVDLPLVLGAEVGILTYGSRTRDRDLFDDVDGIDVQVRTDNKILLSHLVARIQPRSWPVQPYVDGRIGLKHLFTDTRVSDDDDFIASDTNEEDTAFSYGVGGGLVVPLDLGGWRLNFGAGARYLWGTKANYLTKKSVDVKTSDTDLLVTHASIGVAF